MNREQAIGLLKVLKTAYPRFYADMTREEAENTINLWVDMFKDEDPNLVSVATRDLINTFKYPPTIADVKEKMYNLTNLDKETSLEVWHAISKAIRNSAYYFNEEFQKLPDIAKKFVGEPYQLKNWATATDFNEGVVKGQFFKQYEILKQREKEIKMMLPESRKLLESFENKLLNQGGQTNEKN